MRRVVPIALLAALTSGCGSGATTLAASATPSVNSNPLNAAACRQYVTALEWLDKTVAESQTGGYVPLVLQIVARDGEKDVRQAAELADGETRQAMERAAAAIAVLGGTVEDFLAAPKGTIDVADEVVTVGASIDAVRPLCAAAGSPVNILLQ